MDALDSFFVNIVRLTKETPYRYRVDIYFHDALVGQTFAETFVKAKTAKLKIQNMMGSDNE